MSAGAPSASKRAAGEAGVETLEPGRLRVLAGRISKHGTIVTVEGEDGQPAVLESGDLEAGGMRIQAQHVSVNIDPNVQLVQASGQVRLERSRRIVRHPYAFRGSVRRDATGRITVPGSAGGPDTLPRTEPAFSGNISSGESSVGRTERGAGREEFFTEVLAGSNLSFDGKAKRGSLDGAQLRLGIFDISAVTLLLGDDGYRARAVILRPGGLSEHERQIYGTPPFSLRAREVGVLSESGPASNGRPGLIVVSRAGLYFRNTRLLPIPGALLTPLSRLHLGSSRGSASAGQAAGGLSLVRIVPHVSLNSADRILLGARLSYGLGGSAGPNSASLVGDTNQSTAQSQASQSQASNAISSGAQTVVGTGTRRGRARGGSNSTLNLDLGLSGRLGLRGGVSLENRSAVGLLSLQARRSDLIRTQLTSRLQVDRTPELSFDSVLLPVLDLGRGRGIGAFASASAGRFSERQIRSGQPRVESSRLSGTIGLSTRLEERDGLYADIFATRSRYGLSQSSYSNTGFEVGYLGRVLPRVRGLFLLRHDSLDGSTPFLFDTVEIPREFRATFDIEATPRFLIPIGLRYDLDRKTLRDRSVGVLRNYKTFAYGVVYQSAQRDLHLELRTNF